MGVAVIVFALNGKRRDWMPRWQQNWYGWSYIVAVVTCIIETVIGKQKILNIK
jgi:succinate dehydrogenase hydrophobic anchor subunit